MILKETIFKEKLIWKHFYIYLWCNLVSKHLSRPAVYQQHARSCVYFLFLRILLCKGRDRHLNRRILIWHSKYFYILQHTEQSNNYKNQRFSNVNWFTENERCPITAFFVSFYTIIPFPMLKFLWREIIWDKISKILWLKQKKFITCYL